MQIGLNTYLKRTSITLSALLNQTFTGSCEFEGCRSATRACVRAMERIRAGTCDAESGQRKHPRKLPNSSALSQFWVYGE